MLCKLNKEHSQSTKKIKMKNILTAIAHIEKKQKQLDTEKANIIAIELRKMKQEALEHLAAFQPLVETIRKYEPDFILGGVPSNDPTRRVYAKDNAKDGILEVLPNSRKQSMNAREIFDAMNALPNATKYTFNTIKVTLNTCLNKQGRRGGYIIRAGHGLYFRSQNNVNSFSQ